MNALIGPFLTTLVKFISCLFLSVGTAWCSTWPKSCIEEKRYSYMSELFLILHEIVCSIFLVIYSNYQYLTPRFSPSIHLLCRDQSQKFVFIWRSIRSFQRQHSNVSQTMFVYLPILTASSLFSEYKRRGTLGSVSCTVQLLHNS